VIIKAVRMIAKELPKEGVVINGYSAVDVRPFGADLIVPECL